MVLPFLTMPDDVLAHFARQLSDAVFESQNLALHYPLPDCLTGVRPLDPLVSFDE